MVETGVGRLQVEWDAAAEDGGTAVSVDQLVPVATGPRPTRGEVAELLGLPASALGPGPIESWSASRPKLIVPLPDETTLNSLAPHWDLLWDLCDAYETTGIYAFAPAEPAGDREIQVHARQFPARAGYPEDAATGVAAAALAGYLAHHDPRAIGTTGPLTVRIRQGAAMGRPSRLTAQLDRDGTAVTRVRVAGDVLVLGEETIPLRP
jgi:PhzF family phenazine biosynthesis protein